MIPILGIDSRTEVGTREEKKARVQGMDPTCVLDTFRSKFGV